MNCPFARLPASARSFRLLQIEFISLTRGDILHRPHHPCRPTKRHRAARITRSCTQMYSPAPLRYDNRSPAARSIYRKKPHTRRTPITIIGMNPPLPLLLTRSTTSDCATSSIRYQFASRIDCLTQQVLLPKAHLHIIQRHAQAMLTDLESAPRRAARAVSSTSSDNVPIPSDIIDIHSLK